MFGGKIDDMEYWENRFSLSLDSEHWSVWDLVGGKIEGMECENCPNLWLDSELSVCDFVGGKIIDMELFDQMLNHQTQNSLVGKLKLWKE